MSIVPIFMRLHHCHQRGSQSSKLSLQAPISINSSTFPAMSCFLCFISCRKDVRMVEIDNGSRSATATSSEGERKSESLEGKRKNVSKGGKAAASPGSTFLVPKRATGVTISESRTIQVTVCDICGDEGWVQYLAICSKCHDGAEHTYCNNGNWEKARNGNWWLCEDCKNPKLKSSSAEKPKTQGPPMFKSDLKGQLEIATEAYKNAKNAKNDKLSTNEEITVIPHESSVRPHHSPASQSYEENINLLHWQAAETLSTLLWIKKNPN